MRIRTEDLGPYAARVREFEGSFPTAPFALIQLYHRLRLEARGMGCRGASAATQIRRILECPRWKNAKLLTIYGDALVEAGIIEEAAV